VLVYSDHEKAAANGYDFDGWNASHQVYYYTGEGKVGDQVIYMRLWNLHYIAPRKRQDRSFGLWSVCRRSHRGAGRHRRALGQPHRA